MGDDEQAAILAFRELAEEVEDLGSDLAVEVGCGLVSQKDRGPSRQGPGYGDPLFLASAEIRGR